MSSDKNCPCDSSSDNDKESGTTASSNLFSSLLSGSNDVLDYSYTDLIMGPDDYGFSSGGSHITKNMTGLLKYIRLLIEGDAMIMDGVATPLGINAFTSTGSTCKDSKTGKTVARSQFFHGQPTGNIPFLSEAAGSSFSSLKGLIPAMIETSVKIIPTGIASAFTQGDSPSCSEIRMITIDVSGNKNITSAYVIDTEIEDMDPCYFEATQTGKFTTKSKSVSAKKRTNPLTNEKCEGFKNRKLDYSKIPEDNFIKVYYISLTALMFYLIIKIYFKKR
jgi:hypothetical protein